MSTLNANEFYDQMRALSEALNPIAILGFPKIIEDKYCYKVYIKVRGYPAAHHPNRNRPYYRRVKVIKPLMFYMREQNTFVCAPSLIYELRRKLGTL
jgi:hypothetical protein